MLTIEYPEPSFRVKKQGGNDLVFDSIRKRWLLLTPEEWVRQNFVQYLVRTRGYPSTLIALEKEMKLGELKKRFDILVYDKLHKPFMMVECKAPGIKVNENVLQQVLRYNMSIPVEYIIITNGDTSYGWKKGLTGLEQLTEIPNWAF